MIFDQEDIDTLLKLFGLLTTQTEVAKERKLHAEQTIRQFLLDLREHTPAHDPNS